jgi:hypothetical protein
METNLLRFELEIYINIIIINIQTLRNWHHMTWLSDGSDTC